MIKPSDDDVSICSAHRTKRPDCSACQSTIRDLIPNYDELLAEAIAAGITKCSVCNFEYYNTIDDCPCCARKF